VEDNSASPEHSVITSSSNSGVDAYSIFSSSLTSHHGDTENKDKILDKCELQQDTVGDD
jgi:hypothetical protein